MGCQISEKNYFRLALPLFALCIVIPMFSESMLVAALPEIEYEFATGGIYGSWILPVVLLVGAALCPFFGTLGDAYGRKKVLCFCLLIYTGGVIATGFSWDIWSLLFFRALQGMGIAAIPIAFSIIAEQFPAKKVPFGIGVLAASYGIGTMTGVLLGSFIINFWGWRWTYFILIPIVILHLLLIFLIIRRSKETVKKEVDWKGALLLLLSMFFFMLTLTESYHSGIFSEAVLLYAALTVIFAFVFVAVEKRASMPAIDLSLMKRPVVIILSVVAFLVNCMTFLYIQSLPFMVQSPSGLFLEERFVGIIMVPGSIADMIASPLSSFWVQRKGFLRPVLFGSGCMILSPVIFFLMPLSVLSLSVVWILFSIGMAVVSTGYLLRIIKSVPENRTAGATGLLHSSINVGGMTGPVIAGIILATFSSRFLIAGEMRIFPEAQAFSWVFAAGAVMALIVAGLSYRALGIKG
ncbi:MAG: MFS transporter [Methanomicrobiaceae archaeon]|nr:MFS transporter [Methanomicrobiaceae archaeon]